MRRQEAGDELNEVELVFIKSSLSTRASICQVAGLSTSAPSAELETHSFELTTAACVLCFVVFGTFAAVSFILAEPVGTLEKVSEVGRNRWMNLLSPTVGQVLAYTFSISCSFLALIPSVQKFLSIPALILEPSGFRLSRLIKLQRPPALFRYIEVPWVSIVDLRKNRSFSLLGVVDSVEVEYRASSSDPYTRTLQLPASGIGVSADALIVILKRYMRC